MKCSEKSLDFNSTERTMESLWKAEGLGKKTRRKIREKPETREKRDNVSLLKRVPLLSYKKDASKKAGRSGPL